jgi:VWFA-related protein
VEISVIAQDKHGNPVADLAEPDFRLFDNGQEQKIASFSMQSAQVLPRGQSTVESARANIWSNTPKSRSGIPVNLTVILFDGLNTNPTDQVRARDQIIRLLSQIRPEDRVALYALGSELRVLHEFTSDSSVLLRILAKHPAYEGPQVSQPSVDSSNLPVASKPADIDAATSAAIDLFLTSPEELFRQVKTVDRILRTIDAMEAIAAHLAVLPGRKSLLWVSGSFPLHLENVSLTQGGSRTTDQRTFADELQRAARALQDANVAVYPVDARGLNSP